MPPLTGALNCKTKICLEENYFIMCMSIIVRQIYIYIYNNKKEIHKKRAGNGINWATTFDYNWKRTQTLMTGELPPFFISTHTHKHRHTFFYFLFAYLFSIKFHHFFLYLLCSCSNNHTILK